MKTAIIAVGNGGYNLASDIIKANIFPESKFIVCDTDVQSLERNKAKKLMNVSRPINCVNESPRK